MLEFNRLYDRLNINFDNYNGESFYSDMIPEVAEMLEAKGLLEESRGAQVVDLEEFNLNPCITSDADGVEEPIPIFPLEAKVILEIPFVLTTKS